MCHFFKIKNKIKNLHIVYFFIMLNKNDFIMINVYIITFLIIKNINIIILKYKI